MTEDERAIRELVDIWLMATQPGNLRAVLHLMADDVVIMVHGQEPFGKEAFAVNFRQLKHASVGAAREIQQIQITGSPSARGFVWR